MQKLKLFTNVDVFAITRELDIILGNSTIANIYEIKDLLILKINSKEGRLNLIISRDSRINLTNYNYPIPKYPSQYIISLRKFLKNRRIVRISQYNFDRIIILELYNTADGPWKFIIELFNKGNYLLLDEKNNIKIARRYRKFKDRDVLAGREYIFPQSRGKDFLTISYEEFEAIIKSSDAEIVRILARNINIAGLYSEEICYRAGVNKNIKGIDLNGDDLDKLFKSFKNLRNQLLFGKINAHIILDNTGEELAVIPFEMKMFSEYDAKYFNSYNEAVDDYFSKIDSEIIKKPSYKKIDQEIKTQKKILKNQTEYLEELKVKKVKYYEHGDFIYAHFKPLENLLNVILNAKSKRYNWEEINEKLRLARLERLEGSEFFSKIIPSTKQLIIKIGDDDVYLDLNKSLGENANFIYNKGKKAEKKIKGSLSAIEKTKEKIDQIILEKEAVEVEVDFLIKKPKKKWYESFHWFLSSDDFLVIGGRDASSNESVFKKYIDENDLVLHTNFPGSPLTVIKNPNNKPIPEKTIGEAADFVASYSKAWKETWGFVDIFYIQPNQISKSPPSGEFLPKGSFMISGKKNIVKNAKTELIISIEIIEIEKSSEEESKIFYPKVICRPRSAVNHVSKNYLLIIPSKSGLTKGKLAKEILSYFIKITDKEMRKWVKLISLDEIILLLPTGFSEIKKDS